MRIRCKYAFCLVLLATAIASPQDCSLLAQLRATSFPGRSPWDSVHPVLSSESYACPPRIHLEAELSLEGFYSDPSYSVIDPQKLRVYEEASRPASQLANTVAAAEDEYLRSGNIQAAACALEHLESAARDRAFAGKMYTKQAYYVQGWTAGALALDYLKIRSALPPDDSGIRDVQAWFRYIARQTMAYYAEQAQQAGTDARNNHIYWAALEVGAFGIADADDSLWRWSVAVSQSATSEIEPDGTLSLEIAPKARALHYHLFAAAPLVTLAELGCANQFDLYRLHGAALRKLADRSLAGLLNNSYFAEKAGIAQDTPHGAPTAEEVGWAVPYLQHFPDDHFRALVARASSLSYEFTGGLPPPAVGCGVPPGAVSGKRGRTSK